MNKSWLQNKLLVIVMVFVALVAVLGIGGYFYYSSNLKAVGESKENVVFEVKSGETSNVVLDNLKEKKLIKN